MMTLISTLRDNNGEIVRVLNEDEQKQRFFSIYNVNNTKLISASNRDKCFPTRFYKPVAPTLSVLAEAYGEDTAENWMVQQIMFLNENVSVRVRLTDFQVRTLAASLMDKFSDGVDRLNVREILLFFFKLIGGEYGHFYGAVSPDVVGEAAEQFLTWRHNEILRLEREQEAEERKRKQEEDEKNAVPPPPGVLETLQGLYSSFGNGGTSPRRLLNDIRSIDKDHITTFRPKTAEERRTEADHLKEFKARLDEEMANKEIQQTLNNS